MQVKPYKVTIIVPVYKVEKYIRKCLDSIVAQTYNNLEVILVDDGSPDRCGAICDEYADKYPMFSVIHQENQGQAAARNNAVRVARGEYIAYIDSDDFVTDDYVEYLVRIQQEHNADIAIAGFYYLYEGSNPQLSTNDGKTIVMTPEEALTRMNYNRGFGATLWAKLYRKQLILDHPLPIGKLYEDLATIYKYIGDSEKIVYSSKKIYYWLQREGSTMRSAFDERQMAGIEAAAAQLEYTQRRFPTAVPAAKARYMGKIMELMALALSSSNNKAIYQVLKEKMIYYKEVISDPKVKKSIKVRMAAARTGYLSAKLVFMIHENMKKAKYKQMDA